MQTNILLGTSKSLWIIENVELFEFELLRFYCIFFFFFLFFFLKKTSRIWQFAWNIKSVVWGKIRKYFITLFAENCKQLVKCYNCSSSKLLCQTLREPVPLLRWQWTSFMTAHRYLISQSIMLQLRRPCHSIPKFTLSGQEIQMTLQVWVLPKSVEIIFFRMVYHIHFNPYPAEPGYTLLLQTV